MVFVPTPQGGPAGEPLGPICKGCNRAIAHDEPVELVRFEEDCDARFQAMNGLYHADCGKPYLKLACVLEMLSSDPLTKA